MAVQVYGTSKFAMFYKRIQRNLISEGGSFNSLNSVRFISELGSFPLSQFVPWERNSCRTFVSAGDEMSIRNLRQPIVGIMKFAMFYKRIGRIAIRSDVAHKFVEFDWFYKRIHRNLILKVSAIHFAKFDRLYKRNGQNPGWNANYPNR